MKRVIKYSKTTEGQTKHFQIGYFTEKIPTDISKYLSELIFSLKGPDGKVFLKFNLPSMEDMEGICANQTDWTLLFKYEEVARWLLLRVRYVNAVGYCESIGQLSKTLEFVWNRCHESDVTLILAKEIDRDLIKEVDAGKLALNYPIVMKRGHDGCWIDIYCQEPATKNIVEEIKAVNERYSFKTEHSLSLL